MKTILVVMTFLLSVSSAFADAPQGVSEAEEPTLIEPVHPSQQHLRLFGGLRVFQYDYSENIPSKPNFKSDEKGVNPGFRLGLRSSVLNDNATTWELIADITSGNLAYDGGIQNAETGTVTPMTSTSRASFQNYEGNYCFDLFESAGLPRACLGAGFHIWDRVITGTGSIHENYRWMYIPLSLREAILDRPVFQLSLHATFIPLTLGAMTAYLSEGSIADDVTVGLSSRPGYRLQLPMRLRTGPASGIMIEPWFESTAIGHSQETRVTVGGEATKYAIMEPDSRTYQYGIFAGFSVGMN